MLKKNDDISGGRPLRILLSGYRSHPHVGGQGIYIRFLSTALLDLGHQVDVISGPPYPELDPRAGLIKLPSLDLFTEDNAFSALRWKHWHTWADLSEWLSHNSGAFGEPYAFGRRLRKFVAQNPGKYDVLHDNQTLADGLLKINKTLPVIATLHHPISIDLRLALQSEKRWWMRALIRRWHKFLAMQAKTARSLPYILTVSEASKQAALEDFGGRTEQYHVVPNGVDQKIFYPDPKVDRTQNLLVATASADTPLKGLPTLVDAFSRLAPTHPALKLCIIGRLRDGPTKDAIEKHGLADRIEFRPGLDQIEMARLFRQATICLSASLFEGFGLPAAEAMACGAPVIVSNGGALPEVAGDAGIVVPKGDGAALAAATAKLLADPEQRKRLGEAAAKRAKITFSWERHALMSVELYRKALHAHHTT
jgi:glycosyltransferase involved in cell wall biosynthesis